jgi:transposase
MVSDRPLLSIGTAIRYMVRSGGAYYRMLLKDFPPRQTVCWWFRSFVRRLLFRTIDAASAAFDSQFMRHKPMDRRPGG